VVEVCIFQGGADTINIRKHLPIAFPRSSSTMGQMEGLGSVTYIFFQIRLDSASSRKQNSSLQVWKVHKHFDLDAINYSMNVFRWSQVTRQKSTWQKSHVICTH